MSSTLITLFNNISAAGAGSLHSLPATLYKGGAHSIEVSGTFVGTIEFEGRIETNWYSLLSFTVAGLKSYSGLFDAVRGNVTAYTSGALTMKVRYGLEESYSGDLTNIRNETNLLINRLTSGRAGLLDNLTSLDGSVAGTDKAIKALRKTLLEYSKI